MLVAMPKDPIIVIIILVPRTKEQAAPPENIIGCAREGRELGANTNGVGDLEPYFIGGAKDTDRGAKACA